MDYSRRLSRVGVGGLGKMGTWKENGISMTV